MTVEKQQKSQSVNIAGDQNQAVTAQNDLIIGRDLIMTTTIQQKPEFYAPTLEQFKPPDFVSPRITPELITTVQEQNLLVLGGSHEIDKSALARHIAWYLSEDLSQKSNGHNGNISVLEWYRSSDPQSLVVKLRETKTITIFILSDIAPQHVHYDLSSIQKAASNGHHFVVVSTNTPFASWKLHEGPEALFWKDLSPKKLYSPDDLANVLIQKLIEANQNLIEAEEPIPPGLPYEILNPDQPLIKDSKLLIQSVAEQLRTPDNIAVFVQLLYAEKKPLQEEMVHKLIELIQDNKRTLWEWYHNILSPREQLLALGLSFFDGLFEDQFFAALEELVEHVWQRRDTSLRALDYCDLDNLLNFFSFVKTETYGRKVESRLPGQRRLLLEVAWNSHRRQILNALPILAQLVRNSVPGRSSDWELYGTSVRRTQLCRVIGETLSDIGLISTSVVQDTLLQLAADESSEVQSVAALTMARWREFGKDEDLFNMLQQWQFETRVRDLIVAILTGYAEKKQANPQDYIRATVALSVSYAALYDEPNKLSQELCTLLKELSEDQSGLVRDRFSQHTLPVVVQFHLRQLRQMFYDLITKTEYYALIGSLSASLASAYQIIPAEVWATLNDWQNKADRPDFTTKKNPNEISPLEKLRATIARTYLLLPYESVYDTFTREKGMKNIQKVLAEEKYLFVRLVTIHTLAQQMHENFENVQPYLPDLLSEMTNDERKIIINTLADMYLKQRAKLKDSDEFIEVDGYKCSVWKNAKRPLTEIEQVMFSWFKKKDNILTQQIALQSLVRFAQRVDEKEAKHIEEAKKKDELSKNTVTTNNTSTLDLEKVRAVKPLPAKGIGRLISWFITRGAENYRTSVFNLLPVATNHSITIRFLLKRWRYNSDNDIQAIANYLNRALSLNSKVGCLIVLFIVGGLILLCVCPSMFR